MMIKLTERCTMGCSHCMNDAKPDGRDMTLSVLQDCLHFLKEHRLGAYHLIITGGEPTEHRDFDTILKEITMFQKCDKCFSVITVTTNGETIQKNPEKYKNYVKIAKEVGLVLMFQVSADARYYPRRIDVTKRIFREDGFYLFDNCIKQMYPQGRAKDNGYHWEARCSKCYNVRVISHQISKDSVLKDIEDQMTVHAKFCTPHIGIDGSIKLGESDLCPVCTSIYDDMSVIMDKIRQFDCHCCDFINTRLPEKYQSLLRP